MLIFTRTKHGADKLVRQLEQDGVGAAAIHGNKSQNARQAALKDFRKGKVKALVATDIAARGIDIDGLTHVVNFELPNEPESYVHRIGRTARAGASGMAISLCDTDELFYLRDIERTIRQTVQAHNDHDWHAPEVEAMRARPPKPPKRQQGGRGGRPGNMGGGRPQGANANGNRFGKGAGEGQDQRADYRSNRGEHADRKHAGNRGERGRRFGKPGGQRGRAA